MRSLLRATPGLGALNYVCGGEQTHPHKNNQERPRGSSVVPAVS